MTALIAFQTLNSDELVPLTTDVSDLIRTLSDLCIQAYQQLLSITEKRLQNIIGTPTKKTMLMLLILSPPPLLSSHLVLSFSLSPCSVRERDHPRSVCRCGKVGNVQKASRIRPQGLRRRCSHHGVGAEGAGSPSHSFVPSGSASSTDGAGLPSAHLPYVCLCFQQPAAEEGHVLLESWHADTVEIYTDTCRINLKEIPLRCNI